ncbi:uncharacterized protein DSM5745_02598 [Aspergillus mulundensis]|uniref:Methyltransferase domain-containing protein n=1 Tax=Aspergillus mulundensis TaxID=1810919 RepID=A0A3D8SWY6_9EURO|nr:hypothetical protein DSM5745_02598 [Aspergillus mulundensis]RDW90823.1 hypothetical protein DSM5745_02598 [Aspergillus mulundensis]
MTSPNSQTEELDDEYLRVISIQGREYQQYSIDNKVSFEPVDEDEAERLELQHRILSKVFDNRLVFPPIPRLRRVLDCGYGTGAWAVDVAEQNPDCEVIGIDIYPFMNPDDTPENLWLQSTQARGMGSTDRNILQCPIRQRLHYREPRIAAMELAPHEVNGRHQGSQGWDPLEDLVDCSRVYRS